VINKITTSLSVAYNGLRYSIDKALHNRRCRTKSILQAKDMSAVVAAVAPVSLMYFVMKFLWIC
jgi:hypothetical protein